MRFKFFLWAIILIFSLVGVGLSMRVLALNEVPVSESLILRGFSCLLGVLLFARRYSFSLIPRSLKTQIFRALLAGMALTFLSLSYNWLTASTIAVLSNIDVPLLMVLGSLLGVPATKKTQLLSLISILFLVWYISNLEMQINLVYGLGSLTLGSLLLCFGYLYIKKSMADENKAVAILTPSLAIILYGLVEKVWTGGGVSSAWTLTSLSIGFLSGVGMFLAYIATMKLYELTDLASAEFPTLISSIIIQPAELLFLNEPIHKIYLFSSIGFVVMTYLIMRLQKNSEDCDKVNDTEGLEKIYVQ